MEAGRRKKARRDSALGLRSNSSGESGSGSDEDGGESDGGRSRRRRQPTLVCTLESVRLLVALLACLAQGKKDQRVRCEVDAQGLLFTAHSRGKSLQIKTSIGAELFESFELVKAADAGGEDQDEDTEPQLSFALNASMLVECLSIFGPSALGTTSLRMTYAPEVRGGGSGRSRNLPANAG